jgi:hypothetical protein
MRQRQYIMHHILSTRTPREAERTPSGRVCCDRPAGDLSSLDNSAALDEIRAAAADIRRP